MSCRMLIAALATAAAISCPATPGSARLPPERASRQAAYDLGITATRGGPV